MELGWLKKKLPGTLEAQRAMIERGLPELSVRRQCELIGLNRSSLYYQPVGESAYNLQLMRLLDKQYTRTPFYGWWRMTAYLRRGGHSINPKRVRRLMRLMGLQAVYPKPRTSTAAPGHKRYPYLLRGLKIARPCQVWSTDITYLPMQHGFMYLVAVIDWFSRYVLAWQLSNTLDGHFCRVALRQALGRGTPDIFNTDQQGYSVFQLDADKSECLSRPGSESATGSGNIGFAVATHQADSGITQRSHYLGNAAASHL